MDKMTPSIDKTLAFSAMAPTASKNCNGLAKGNSAFSTRSLPESYVLHDNDVLCGRGARCFNHPGNQRFRQLIDSQLERYACKTLSKLDKSAVIQEIVTFIRSTSPGGGFVKLDPITGRYNEVGDFLAREKTSQAFRDALHDQYKSSNDRKKKRSHFISQSESDISHNSGLDSLLSGSYSVRDLLPLPSISPTIPDQCHQAMFVTPTNSMDALMFQSKSFIDQVSTKTSSNNAQFQSSPDITVAKATFASLSAQLEMLRKKIDAYDNASLIANVVPKQEQQYVHTPASIGIPEMDEAILPDLTLSQQRNYDRRFSLTTSFVPLLYDASFSDFDNLFEDDM